MSIQDQEFELVSQLSHVFSGWAILLTIGHYGGLRWFWPCLGVYVLYAGVKEFWFDLHYESVEVRGSSLKDFLFQLLGAAIAVVVSLT